MRKFVDFDSTIDNIATESYKLDFDTAEYKVSYESLLASHHDLKYTIDREISRANALVISTQEQIAQEGMLEDAFNKIKELFLAFIKKLKEIWDKIVEKVKAFFSKLFNFFKTDDDINTIAKITLGKKGKQLTHEDDNSRVILLWNEELVKSKIKHFPNLLAIDKDMIKALNNLCYSFPYHYEEYFPIIMTEHFSVVKLMFNIKNSEEFLDLKRDMKRKIDQFDKALDKLRIPDRNNHPTLIVKNGETYNLTVDTSNEDDNTNWFKAELTKNDTTIDDEITGYDLSSGLLNGLISVIKDRRGSIRGSTALSMIHNRLHQDIKVIINKFSDENIELTQQQAGSMLSYLAVTINKLPLGLNQTIMDSTMEAIKLLKLLRKTTPLLVTDIITPELVFGIGRKPLSGMIYNAFASPTPTTINKEFIDKLSSITFDDLMQNQFIMSELELSTYTKEKFTIANGEITIHYLGRTNHPSIDGNCYALPGNVLISLLAVEKLYNSPINSKYNFSKDYIRKALVCHEVGHIVHLRQLGVTKPGDITLNGIVMEMQQWKQADNRGAYASHVSKTIAPDEAFADAFMVKKMGMDKETYIKFNNLLAPMINTNEEEGYADDNQSEDENGDMTYTNNKEGKVRYNLRVDNVFDLASQI